jgi:ArsR family transcriptional regulator, cadmium/lead-responsive transcriptional repressor
MLASVAGCLCADVPGRRRALPLTMSDIATPLDRPGTSCWTAPHDSPTSAARWLDGACWSIYHISTYLYVYLTAGETDVAVTHDRATTLKAKLFRGLADPSRLLIVETLRSGEKTVSQVVEHTGLSQPNASAHLSCLQDCGLVTRRQDGRFVYYALADDRMEQVLQAAEGILSAVADNLYACTRYTT